MGQYHWKLFKFLWFLVVSWFIYEKWITCQADDNSVHHTVVTKKGLTNFHQSNTQKFWRQLIKKEFNGHWTKWHRVENEHFWPKISIWIAVPLGTKCQFAIYRKIKRYDSKLLKNKRIIHTVMFYTHPCSTQLKSSL